MTALEQPDLFGEYDRAQELREVYAKPQVCPYCGSDEPNGMLLRNNHGVDPLTGKANAGWETCMAQRLTSNHLTWAVRQGIDRTPYINRVTELGVDPEPIIEQAEAELPDLCVVCRHNKKTRGDYCINPPCMKEGNLL